MHEITCPHCGKAFTIDEAGYADIVAQVRTKEFNAELQDRLHAAEKDKANAVELAKSQLTAQLQQAAAAKDSEIQALKAKLDADEVAKQLAVREAVAAVEKQRDELASGLERAQLEKQLAETSLKEKYETELRRATRRSRTATTPSNACGT